MVKKTQQQQQTKQYSRRRAGVFALGVRTHSSQARNFRHLYWTLTHVLQIDTSCSHGETGTHTSSVLGADILWYM